MESDAPYTQGGESGQVHPYSRCTPNRGTGGSRKTFSAYTEAVALHGVKSPEARAAAKEAIADGWSPSGIAAEVETFIPPRREERIVLPKDDYIR